MSGCPGHAMATACPPLPLPVRTPRPSGRPAKLLSYSSSPRFELPERSVPALILISPGLRHKRLRSLTPLVWCRLSRPVLDASLCKLRARDRFIHGQKSRNCIYQTTCQPHVAMRNTLDTGTSAVHRAWGFGTSMTHGKDNACPILDKTCP